MANSVIMFYLYKYVIYHDDKLNKYKYKQKSFMMMKKKKK